MHRLRYEELTQHSLGACCQRRREAGIRLNEGSSPGNRALISDAVHASALPHRRGLCQYQKLPARPLHAALSQSLRSRTQLAEIAGVMPHALYADEDWYVELQAISNVQLFS